MASTSGRSSRSTLTQHEALVHQRGDLRVLEGLALHDVAPVAGASSRSRRAAACPPRAARRSASSPHGQPVDGVVAVLEQVGRRLVRRARWPCSEGTARRRDVRTLAEPSPPTRPPPSGPTATPSVAGGLLFCSGQIPLDPATRRARRRQLGEQARRCLENLDGGLRRRGRDAGRRRAADRLPRPTWARSPRSTRSTARSSTATRRPARRSASPRCRRARRSRSTRSSRCRTDVAMAAHRRPSTSRTSRARARDRRRRRATRRCCRRATLSERTGGDGRAEGREPAAHGVVQDPRRAEQARRARRRLRAAASSRGSAGNHAQALAQAARARGVPCEVFMPARARRSRRSRRAARSARRSGTSAARRSTTASPPRRERAARGRHGLRPPLRRPRRRRRPGHARARAARGRARPREGRRPGRRRRPGQRRRDRGQVGAARGRGRRRAGRDRRAPIRRRCARGEPVDVAGGADDRRRHRRQAARARSRCRSCARWLDDVVVVPEDDVAEAMVLLHGEGEARRRGRGRGRRGGAAGRPGRRAAPRGHDGASCSAAATSTRGCSRRSRAATRPRPAGGWSLLHPRARPPGLAGAAARARRRGGREPRRRRAPARGRRPPRPRDRRCSSSWRRARASTPPRSSTRCRARATRPASCTEGRRRTAAALAQRRPRLQRGRVGAADPAVDEERRGRDEARLVAGQEERPRWRSPRGAPKRPTGTWTIRRAACSGSAAKSSSRSGVSTGPGQSALTRTPRRANSTPSSRESARTPPLDAV